MKTRFKLAGEATGLANRIKAISFDGDATLWDFQKVMRHSLAIALLELQRRTPGSRADNLTVDEMIRIRDAVATELKSKTTNLEEIRLAAFKRTVEAIGFQDDALAADLNAVYLRHRFEDIELYPDVIGTLDALSSRYSLGLLSNGNGYPERCGLPERFSFVVFSQDFGVEKPDPTIFHEACRQAGCTPSQLMHVGDSLESDVVGAKAAGAVAVWLNRTQLANETAVCPDYEVSSLAELITLANNPWSSGPCGPRKA